MTDLQTPSPDCLPNALEALDRVRGEIGGRAIAFFLDLDGTLAPIVDRPDKVLLPPTTRRVLDRLSRDHLLCLVSGRGLEDLKDRVGLQRAYYAADHGHRLVGPPDSAVALEIGGEHRGRLHAAAAELEGLLATVPGALVESKGLSLSVHYRLVAPDSRRLVSRAVKRVSESFSDLSLTQGKMVYELRPPGDWNKGRATLWLLQRLAMKPHDSCPLCVGDDLTDEDMFSAIDGWGIGVLVGTPGRRTRARYRLRDPAEVASFLALFAPED
jgi:trehalose 6-phosphate phosphatase